ncbi:MAG: hypothetical protein QGG67_06190 [Gammaproteobacteria bacterium]|nr:hypothetical protein [Gammaproteobacteria bacterium]
MTAGNATYGAGLMSHEPGHNLNLGHCTECANLMRVNLGANTSTYLDTGQVAAVLASPLVQSSGGAFLSVRWIDITPVLIVAVPLPAALPMMLSALGLLEVIRRRRRSDQHRNFRQG